MHRAAAQRGLAVRGRASLRRGGKNLLKSMLPPHPAERRWAKSLAVEFAVVQQAMKRRPDADWQRLDLLTRDRDLLAEFYMEVKL